MLQTTLDAVSHFTKFTLDTDQWDISPLLVVVNHRGEEALMALTGGDVYQLLDVVSENLHRVSDKFDTQRITGLLLMTEGWALAADRTKEGDEERLNADIAALRAIGRDFSDHPEAIEVKNMTVVDITGHTTYQLKRGQGEFSEIPEMTGKIIARLQEMVRAHA